MHSQNQEEKYILEYFDKISHGPTPPDWVIYGRKPAFIDIGCNDGITFSNTRALALLGWEGILIDPSPKAIAQCKQLYKGHKGIYIYEYAISGHNGKAILQESGPLCTPADIGMVSTFHQHEKERFQRTVKYEPIEVKTFKWKTALNRWKIKTFDMVSADCEGDEMSFLPDMDLSKTKLVVLEHNSKPEVRKQYLECTSKYGLDKVIYESAENIIIAR